MTEHIIIGIIFLVAIIYLANIVRKSFSARESSCAKGCGTCSTVDLKKIEAEVLKQQKAAK